MRPFVGRGFLSLLLSCLAVSPWIAPALLAQDVDSLGPAFSAAPNDQATAAVTLPRFASTEHDLGALDDAQVRSLAEPETGGRARVGIVRQLDRAVTFDGFADLGASSRFPRVAGDGMLDRDAEGHLVWSASFSSAGAGAIRVHFASIELPEGASMVISGDGEVRGPYAFDSRRADFWTHAVAGERATITITFADLPANESALTSVVIDAVAHLSGGIFAPHDPAQAQPKSTSCLVDVSCASSSMPVDQFSRSIALVSFNLNGTVYSCSGALLNNTSQDYTPYLIASNQCINTAAVASSVIAYFDYRTPSCGGAAPSLSSLPQTNGASLLYTNSSNDVTFLLLGQRPSGNRIYLGWSSQDVSHMDGTTYYRISHTQGGPQNYAEQKVEANPPNGFCSNLPQGTFIYLQLTQGGYGPGSPGGPLVTNDLRLVGSHYGTCGHNLANPCDSVNNATVDSAFASAFADLRQFLAPSAVLPPTPSGPDVILSASPKGLVTVANTAGATDAFTLTNIGSDPTSITLRTSGTFFTESPESFQLAPGASQVVTLNAKAMAAGSYAGSSVPSGTGVPNGLVVPIRMLSAPAPSGPTSAKAAQNRIDIASTGNLDSGTALFTNTGSIPLSGIVVSSAEWLIPQSSLLTIPPGGSVAAAFQIDRTKRPAGSDYGSEAASLSLVYLTTPLTKSTNVTTMSTAVNVIDTARPAVSPSTLTPLQPNEIALFLPTVGHVQGSVGVFLSDISIVNPTASGSTSPIKIYYTPSVGGTSLTQLTPLAANASVAVADVVKTVFGSATVGTIQIRTPDVNNLRVNATIFNVSNPRGTYGSTIPTFRSDRSATPGSKLVLTGLLRDSASHTNVFIQETSGYPATVTTDFRNAGGQVISSRTDPVGGFGFLQLLNSVPPTAVAAVITNSTSSQGRIAAYATPVDERSGDTWAVVDWARQYGYSHTEPVTIPVAGAVHGANNTYFRTDVWITNSGTTTARAMLRYSLSTGSAVDKSISIPALQSVAYPDVVTTFFQVNGDSVGSITVTPTSGEIALTSRTYTTNPVDPGTFGSSIPAFAIAGAVHAGNSLRIGGLADSTVATVGNKTPATFRTNYGMVETAGAAATVRVSILFRDPRNVAGAVSPIGSRVINLSPKQFLTVTGLVSSVLGPGRETNFGDLHNVQVQFDVTSTTGAVVFYTSSVDNGTGDSIFRSE